MISSAYNTKLKKVWRPNWLLSINELTSLELQQKSWLDKNAPSPHWSFVEFMCSYFDGLAVDNNYEDPLKRNLLSENEFKIVENWHKELDAYQTPNNKDYDVSAILNDTEWLRIIEIGEKTKEALSEVLADNEKVILLENIDYEKIKTITNNDLS